MKKNPILTILALALFAAASQFAAAQSAAAIFNSKTTITWMGVDFTQVKALGETGTVSGVEMITQFAKINDLVIKENDKYNWREALNRVDIPYELGPVTKANEGIDPDGLISTSSADKNRIEEADLAKLVKGYTSKSEGVGLVLFMETLDKPKEVASMWVTFFDMSSGKILIAEHMTGKAMGFGFRNHWARTVYEVIKEIKKSQYKAWKAKYGK